MLDLTLGVIKYRAVFNDCAQPLVLIEDNYE